MKILTFLCTIMMSIVSLANTNWSNAELEPLHKFFTNEHIPQSAWPEVIYIEEAQLPSMPQNILTQTLLTPAIAQYYQRTPKIRAPLQMDDDTKNNHYYRAIIMLVDNDAKRDDAIAADRLKQSTVVELGLISINFSALPQAMIAAVRQGEIPFGTLLTEHKITADSINARFFKMTCDQHLAKYLQCAVGHTLYGRTNTLVRDDNHVWIAHVVEILTSAQL